MGSRSQHVSSNVQMGCGQCAQVRESAIYIICIDLIYMDKWGCGQRTGICIHLKYGFPSLNFQVKIRTDRNRLARWPGGGQKHSRL